MAGIETFSFNVEAHRPTQGRVWPKALHFSCCRVAELDIVK